MEIRSFGNSAAPQVSGESRTIEGYAIVFGQESEVLFDKSKKRRFIEVIQPGAVTQELLERSDVKALLEHNAQRMLARSYNGKGTLTLTVDAHGVKYRFDAPATPDGDYSVEMVKRGDLFGSSFAYATSEKNVRYPEQLEGIRESAKINTALLDYISENIREGMSTEEIDVLVYDFTTSHGAIPAPLNYEGFPKSVCTSINDVVCHGIPNKNEILKSGDIINVDVSTIYKGYFSDASRMFMIGDVNLDMQKLVQVTKECMEIGIAAAQPWKQLGDVGAAIQEHAEKNGFSVVRDLCGHGVGMQFHEEPDVEHFGRRGTGMMIVPGMTFTIEPMINMGTYEVFVDDADGWTVCTDDGLPSAQWENMILITETGNEILTY